MTVLAGAACNGWVTSLDLLALRVAQYMMQCCCAVWNGTCFFAFLVCALYAAQRGCVRVCSKAITHGNLTIITLCLSRLLAAVVPASMLG
jgi:hypothetical protein